MLLEQSSVPQICKNMRESCRAVLKECTKMIQLVTTEIAVNKREKLQRKPSVCSCLSAHISSSSIGSFSLIECFAKWSKLENERDPLVWPVLCGFPSLPILLMERRPLFLRKNGNFALSSCKESQRHLRKRERLTKRV